MIEEDYFIRVYEFVNNRSAEKVSNIEKLKYLRQKTHKKVKRKKYKKVNKIISQV